MIDNGNAQKTLKLQVAHDRRAAPPLGSPPLSSIFEVGMKAGERRRLVISVDRL